MAETGAPLSDGGEGLRRVQRDLELQRRASVDRILLVLAATEVLLCAAALSLPALSGPRWLTTGVLLLIAGLTLAPAAWVRTRNPASLTPSYLVSLAQMLMATVIASLAGAWAGSQILLVLSLIVITRYRDNYLLLVSAALPLLLNLLATFVVPNLLPYPRSPSMMGAAGLASSIVALTALLAMNNARAHQDELNAAAFRLEAERLREKDAALAVQRAAEAEADRELFRELYDEAPVGYLELNRAGEIVRINRTACVMFGFNSDEMLGLPLWRFAQQPEVSRDEIEARLTGDRPLSTHQMTFVRRDGRPLHAILEDRVCRDASGAVTGIRSALQDNTERRTAEERLREVMRGASCVVWSGSARSTGDGCEWTTSVLEPAAAQSFLPVTPGAGETYEQAWRRAVDPADRAEGERIRDEAISTGRAGYTWEFRWRGSDARDRWLREQADIRPAGEGSWDVSGLVVDITEARQAILALRESEALYHSLVDTLPVNIIRKDLEGRFVFVNSRCAETLERPAEELIGKTDLDLFPPDLAADYRSDDAEVIAKRQVLDKAELNRLPGGEVAQVRVLKSPVYGLKGEVSGVQVMFWDITAERRREEGRRRLATTLDATNDLVALSSRDRTLSYLNEAGQRLLGVGSPEGITLEQLFTPGDREILMESARPVALECGIWHGELRLAGRDGTAIPALVTLIAHKSELGEDAYFSLIARDVTAEKEHQAALQRARDDALSASKAKSEFLANMSHEIRTPMNGVLGMTELALQTDLDPEQREYLEIARSSAESLLSIINDILDFSKIEAGKLELAIEGFSIRELMARTMRTLGLRAHEKNLELLYSVSADVPDRLKGDPGRLRQVLVNLLGNAIKFTSAGEVEVSLTAEESADGLILHCAVRDTGIGIPPDQQDRIFGSFEQADTSTTRRFGGTGLGLTISARLVELMGGTIWVESGEGEGSTFHFTARLEVEAAADESGVDAHEALVGRSVLVVDDNAVNRRLLQDLLRNWGMEPSCAESGAEGLAWLREAARAGRPFDLLILDAMLPDVDGFTTARAIDDDPELKELPVLILSSIDSGAQAGRQVAKCVVRSLLKPIIASELLAALQQVCSASRAELELSESPTAASAPETPLRILVAEDNKVNQKVARRMLENAGHSVTIVEDGAAAVEETASGDFDLVLMDIQMPLLNGIEATRQIREREEATGLHLPIIAMTAHAMMGDRERCIEAGMDGYISKPIRSVDLFQTIHRSLHDTGAEAIARPGDTGPPLFDQGFLLQTCEGSREAACELALGFVEHASTIPQRLRTAVAETDLATVAALAHSIKGSAGYFGGGSLPSEAEDLEDLVEAGEVEAIRGRVDTFIGRLEELLDALRLFCEEPGADERIPAGQQQPLPFDART